MINKNADALQGDGGVPDRSSLQPGKPDQLHYSGSNTIKSGPLLLSSRGIGWTSWKNRWFILTKTSLVFFKSDPNDIAQKGAEANLTLGGIDLNNSGSVAVKPDKKLLTVLFPDGRSFTLKAETMEDLNEWKTALENALAQAPNPADVTGQNGLIKNEQTESKAKEREARRSKVIGQPILHALEDADGNPTFLEKGLRFIEEHGVKVEGILRQAADVADVEFRVREYEQGKVDFSAEEDAHVIADCVKHVLRELPSPPVPASCCKALLEACGTERGSRISDMRAAICETFPEPNRRLLQRILMMMQAVASHKAENLMSSSAVAACMAPLLLRALFLGECEIEHYFDVGSDGSDQLLQAAAAANHAQAIVITLLDEYDSLFGEARVSPDMYIESDEGSETGSEVSDVESYDDDDDYDDEDDEKGDEDDDDEEEQDESVESDADGDDEDVVSEASSKTGNSGEYNAPDDRDRNHSSPKSSDMSEDLKVNLVASSISHEDHVRNSENLDVPSFTASGVDKSNKPSGVRKGVFKDESTVNHTSSTNSTNASSIKKSVTMSNAPARDYRHHRSKWGRTSARKNLSMESIEFLVEEDDVGIGMFEAAKTELQNKFADDVKQNTRLQHDLRKQNSPSHERHLAIEKDAKAELEELALLEADLTSLERKVNDLRMRLNLQPKTNQDSNHETKLKNKPDTEVTATSQFGKPRSKDCEVGAENDNERRLGSTSLQSNHPPQKNSKRFGIKKEVANPLTKLSFRLNFTKDKGNQPLPSANNNNASGGSELHSVSSIIPEKGKGSEFRQPLTSPGKSRGSEIHSGSSIIPEKGRGGGLGSSFHIPDKGSGKEGGGPSSSSVQVSDKMGKSGEHSEKRSQQRPQHLDRGKSEEGHKPYNVDKGR